MRNQQFGNQFNLMQKVFWVFFTVVALGMFVYVGAVGYMIYTVASDPGSVGKFASDIVNGYNR